MFRLRITALFLGAFPLLAAINEPVRVDNGLLSGVAGATSPEVRVFKGVPYAAAPVGDLRWRAPRAAPKWDGVRKAESFAPICMQRSATANFPPNVGSHPAMQLSEDCLYLNIYTAAKSARDRRPVMVWIHGGAFTSGAGELYDGEELAKKGAVVVTVNYRLGVFGFLAHPELTKESDRNSSGNYALLDQIAALEWVQKNIAAFGGDPKRVTIFGESAGSWSVNYLVATPLAHGLFQRAIGESGGEFAPGRKLADAEQAGVKFAQSVGANSITELRAKPADELQKANGFQAAATVDGWFLPHDVYTIFSEGKQNDVPVLIGSNADEGTLFTPPNVKGETFRETAQRRFGPDADNFLKLYPFNSDQEARAAQAASMRDQTFGWEMRTWARMQSKTGKSKAYVYFFSRVPPGPAGTRLGSSHGAEIAYVFDIVNGKADPAPPWQDVDKKLAGEISSYWLNFAATGDPNGKGLPKWPAYRATDDTAMSFGDDAAVKPLPHKEALDFLDGYYERQRQNATKQ